MLIIFDTTYNDSSAFSDTPAMDIRVLYAKRMLEVAPKAMYFLYTLPRIVSHFRWTYHGFAQSDCEQKIRHRHLFSTTKTMVSRRISDGPTMISRKRN